MLNKKVAQALNEQINREMYSAYLYMSMSAHANNIGLKGFANWFMSQYHEEMFHAMKMYEYVLRQGARVKLLAVAEPPEGGRANRAVEAALAAALGLARSRVRVVAGAAARLKQVELDGLDGPEAERRIAAALAGPARRGREGDDGE